MGQALRRATGRLQSSRPPDPPPVMARKPELRPPPPPVPASHDVQDRLDAPKSEDSSRIKNDLGVVLEERDPGYDAMLNKIVGRISTKPGGKLEMGEAFIVEKYNRPMPKLRSTKAETAEHKKESVPPGTLSVVQLQQIIRLHQGKSDEHQAPMAIPDIARRFNLDAAQVEKIVQFVSLLPEEQKNSET